jgi:integrase
MKLTVAAVERIKPDPKRRLELPDRHLTGLYLIVQPKGAKSWAVRYRHAGKSRKLTVGPYPALGLLAAREQAKAALRRIAEGFDPGLEKQVARRQAVGKRDTFEAIARLFIERDQRPHNKSWKLTAAYLGLAAAKDGAELEVVKNGLVERWSRRKIGAITRADIIAEIDTVFDRAPTSANRFLAVQRRLFNWCLSRDMIPFSPAAGIEAPAEERARERVLTDVELRNVWSAARELEWPFAPFVQLLILTGQRRSEVAGLQWSELNIKEKVWTLPASRAKNDAEHKVPLSVQALRVIEELPRTKGVSFVFSTTGRTGVSGFSHLKKKLDEKSGVANWTLHDIRRSVATGMAKLGITLPTIEKLLNHVGGSFGGIVGVYQRHQFEAEKRTALDAWGRYIAGLIEPTAENVLEFSKTTKAI